MVTTLPFKTVQNGTIRNRISLQFVKLGCNNMWIVLCQLLFVLSDIIKVTIMLGAVSMPITEQPLTLTDFRIMFMQTSCCFASTLKSGQS